MSLRMILRFDNVVPRRQQLTCGFNNSIRSHSLIGQPVLCNLHISFRVRMTFEIILYNTKHYKIIIYLNVIYNLV
ncbi:hypothetical protein L6452_20997 [Arctium lappa]|uniref:Uncharacterized protein n=1 Tax=Arctium lappa TaxID=4217 RepID=A0ACB9BDF4_ARCLA|nr:hypothetical protein L6452_20997 [Arctium lappa]